MRHITGEVIREKVNKAGAQWFPTFGRGRPMIAVSDVLLRAADLLDKGVCRGANARLPDGKACGVFDQRASVFSMYGAICKVLGPGLGDDKALQASPAWKLILLRAWDALPQDRHAGRLGYALHELNDYSTERGDLFRRWSADLGVLALGEWRAA